MQKYTAVMFAIEAERLTFLVRQSCWHHCVITIDYSKSAGGVYKTFWKRLSLTECLFAM